MRGVILAGIVYCIAVLQAVSQSTFTGQVISRISYTGEVASFKSILPQSSVQFYSNTRSKRITDGNTAALAGDVVTDFTQDSTYFIFSGSQTVYGVKNEKMDDFDGNLGQKWVKTEETDTILGHFVQKYTCEDTSFVRSYFTHYWITPDYQTFPVCGNKYGAWTPPASIPGMILRREKDINLMGVILHETEEVVFIETGDFFDAFKLPPMYRYEAGYPPVLKILEGK